MQQLSELISKWFETPQNHVLFYWQSLSAAPYFHPDCFPKVRMAEA